MRFSHSLVGLLLGSVACVLAQQDPLAALKTAIRNDVAAQNAARPAVPSGNRLSAEQSALYALDRMATDDPARAEETLRQLLGTDLPDPLRTQVSITLQQIQQARTAKAKAFEGEVNAAVQKAGATVLKAQKASEIDPVLADLRRVIEAGRTRQNSDVSEARNQADRAIRFAQNWQDYLWAMESGKFGAAVQKLTGMTQGEEAPPGVGRSLLLERLRVAEEAEKNQSKGAASRALQNIRNLDDLGVAIGQLRGDSYTGRSAELQAALNALDPIYKAYTAYKNGWATSLPLGYGYASGSEIDPVISRLRTDLFLRVLPRVLGVEGKMEPNSGETIDQFLARVRQSALKAGDYDLLGRTITATRDISLNLSGTVDSSFGQDYGAFLSLREAQNDERAHRFADAVIAYRSVLRNGSAGIPAEMIGERLSAIEKQQPDEYRRGTEIFQHSDGRDFRPHPMPEPTRPLGIPPVSPVPSVLPQTLPSPVSSATASTPIPPAIPKQSP